MADHSGQHQGPPRPGPEHKYLEPFVGRFRAKVTIHMGPGQPMESTGIMTNSFRLGGLYLFQDYVGDKSEGPSPSFEGQGYWGYNTSAKKYEGFWVDNASTMMQLERGEVDASGKVWTMHGEFTHPATGQPIKKRSVITLIDHDRNRMESYFTSPDGGERQTMTIEYQRA